MNTLAAVGAGKSIILTKRQYDALSTAAPYVAAYGPRVAGSAAKFTYRGASYAARKIQRTWKKRAQSKIGDPIGSGTSKRQINFVDGATLVSLDNRTAYWHNMADLNTTTSNVINARQRDMVQLTGFKVCMQIKNNSDTPLCFNMAVISPRGKQGALGTGAAGNATNIPGFFRSNSTARSVDFNVGITSVQFHCLPINSDDWTVLAHKRSLISPTGSTTDFNKQLGPNYSQIKEWFSIKRQIRYDDAGEAEDPVYFIYWYDEFQALSGAIAGTVTALQVQREFVTYFKEPKT